MTEEPASNAWGPRFTRAKRQLESVGIDEAESALRWLAGYLLHCGLMDVARHAEKSPDAETAARWEDGVSRLARHEPVQYIIGETDFDGLRIRCDRRALIPRPETEELVGMAADFLCQRGGGRTPVAVDVCTGTGCIACALARRIQPLRMLATDISNDALALARENATTLAVDVEFYRTDLLAGLPDACADLVVANPPYISTAECSRLPANVRNYEPRLALDGGRIGTEVISRLVLEASRVLSSKGRLMMEIGEDQSKAVEQICQQIPQIQFLEARSDFAGQVRFILAERKPSRHPTIDGSIIRARDGDATAG